MVGRSKPQKLSERKPSVGLDRSNAENVYLKAKNVELAKALADSKNAYAQIVEERDFLQRELFSACLRNTKFENFVKTIDTAARAAINTIVSSSNHITDILQITSSIQRLTNLEETQHPFRPTEIRNSRNSSPGLSNKTQAVKPMVGGHVIFRPTINLRRVNEIPLEEIQRLQSGCSHTQINNHDHSYDNDASGSSNQDSPSSSSFQCRSSTRNVRTFRSPQQSANQDTETAENQLEEDLTDHSSELSDTPGAINNGLGTVHEEQEEELGNTIPSENHLSSLANASRSSLNLSGNNSQVPLLSGVFRDVRVYLSPMQNLGQHLDQRQNNVTKERGSSKSKKSRRTRSTYSTRSDENACSTSTENRKSSLNNVNTSQSINLPTSVQNFSGTNSFSDVSHNSVLENSVLTSTKICSSTLRQDGDSSSSTLMNNSGWPTCTNKLERCDSFSGKLTESSKKSYTVSSSKSSSSTSYDPLEGPSNLLDSYDSETKSKLETLGGLGLQPKFLQTSTPQSPSSPAATVLQRREHNLKQSDNGTPKKVKKTNQVVKRKAIEKKKVSLVSTKLPKVLVRKLSLGKRPRSISPQRRSSGSSRRNSLDNSSEKQVLDISRKRKSVDGPPEKKQNSSRSTSATSQSKGTSVKIRSNNNENIPPPKKRGRKPKIGTKSSEIVKDSKSETATTPRKRGRPRRMIQQASLKEPSLRQKLRRSK